MTVYVGTTDTTAPDGSNAAHLVVDTTTWAAYCGKTVAEAYTVPSSELGVAVTCVSCRRGASQESGR